MTTQTAQTPPTVTRDPQFSDVYYITNAAGETRTYIDYGQDAPPTVSPVTMTTSALCAAALTARIETDNAQRAHDAALTAARATYGERPPQPIQDQLSASWSAVLITREAERQADTALKAYIDAQHNRHDVCNETAYGMTQRAQRMIRVF